MIITRDQLVITCRAVTLALTRSWESPERDVYLQLSGVERRVTGLDIPHYIKSDFPIREAFKKIVTNVTKGGGNPPTKC